MIVEEKKTLMSVPNPIGYIQLPVSKIKSSLSYNKRRSVISVADALRCTRVEMSKADAPVMVKYGERKTPSMNAYRTRSYESYQSPSFVPCCWFSTWRALTALLTSAVAISSHFDFSSALIVSMGPTRSYNMREIRRLISVY